MMGDEFSDADAHNPDHPRYWPRKEFEAMTAQVNLDWIKDGQLKGKTHGDIQREAIRRLKLKRWP